MGAAVRSRRTSERRGLLRILGLGFLGFRRIGWRVGEGVDGGRRREEEVVRRVSSPIYSCGGSGLKK